ncbi:hybrid sensor histidine kinase/response regulator transcription factor [Pedobacter arcticus]|uniref:hybrid sensor histidine kinase/response regulator transcription factor n=1 Tax=Pedobacter arcticus TaxID=752140 RepID=UPI0002FFB7A1|nr:hybrid sensor histidine kinase/response regulator transcription factor [Pedobacter arcticus]
MTRFLTLQVILLLFGVCSYASIQHLDTSNGLSNNEVTSIYQDHKGFVWIGTYDGLNRFDGYKFITFRHSLSNSNSLINNTVLCIEQDSSRNLWIGTEGGVSRYDILNAKFDQLRFFDQKSRKVEGVKGRVNMIKESSPGTIVIASETAGLLIYKSNSNFAKNIPIWINNKAVYNYNAGAVTVGPDKKIWVLVNGLGLYTYEEKSKRLVRREGALKAGNFILADDFKNIWIGTDKGLYKYASTGELSISKKNIKITHLSIDQEKKLWISSDGEGVLILDIPKNNFYNYKPKNQNRFLENPVVYTTFEDKEDRKWIASLRSGIVLIDENKLFFQTYSHVLDNKTNLNADFVLAICKDSEGSLWVGTDGNGIKKWDEEMKSFISYQHQPDNSQSISNNKVTDIIEDKKGDIWINTWSGGVNRHIKKQNGFKNYKLYNTKTKSFDRFGWRVFEDTNGTIWASCFNGGLYCYNPSTDNFDLFDDGLKSVLCFAEDKNGDLWVGNRTSVIKVDRIKKKHISFFIGYQIRAIHQDAKSQIWVGTEGGGLLKFNPQTKTYQRFTVENGLSNNSILNILEDKNGFLWMSTYNGISSFNISTQKINTYTKSDGLQNNQFNYNAAFAISDHEFVFGGIKGFNVFNPLDADRSHFNIKPFNISLDGIRINNVDIKENARYVTKVNSDRITVLTIPYSQANVSFDFVMPEFSSADKIQYAFLLGGLEKNWNYSQNIRAANYGRLPIGNYKLYAKSTDRMGNWLSPIHLLDIRVLAPWYLTWWAYAVYVGLVVGVFVLYYRYKAEKRETEYRILESIREKEREKELNEKRLAFFTNISHEFRTPLTLILNPLQELIVQNNPTAELDIAYRSTKRLMNLVDQLLLFRKVENEFGEPSYSKVDFVSFCKEIYSYFTQQAESKHIEYSFLCAYEKLDLQIDRGKTEIALFNILGNAMKFTGDGGKISVEISTNEQQVFVEIKDNGIGIAKEVGEKLFDNFYQIKPDKKVKSRGFGIGLYLAKKIIEQQNGTISYKSELGKGTVFYISLPLVNELSISTMDNLENTFSLTSLGEIINPETLDPAIREEDKKTRPNVAISEKKSLLIIDDNTEIRQYIKDIFSQNNIIYEADNGLTGLEMAQKLLPDLIISDLAMPGLTGVELCQKVKNDINISHIPIVLLTGNNTKEAKLDGIESGAVDYIVKPFDKALLVAKITSLLDNNNRLQQYFLEAITLQNSSSKVPSEFKYFLDRCITIIESNIDNNDFNVQKLATEMGMSHSNLYKKVKAISGLTVNAFIRSIRLRRAAVLMLKSNYNINQASFEVGIADVKYFRLHFFKLFGLKPSEYIRKYRNNFNQDSTIVR